MTFTQCRITLTYSQHFKLSGAFNFIFRLLIFFFTEENRLVHKMLITFMPETNK